MLIRHIRAMFEVRRSSSGREEMGKSAVCAPMSRSMHAPAAEPDAACKNSTALFINVFSNFALLAHAVISELGRHKCEDECGSNAKQTAD